LTTKTDRSEKFSERFSGALFSSADRDAARDGISYRAPLAIAMLSVAFEQTQQHGWGSIALDWGEIAIGIGLCSAALLCLFSKSSRLGVALFTVAAAFEYLPQWMVVHNHGWLAMWTIPMAVIFSQWWRSDLYSRYLRITLGIVMLAAFAQKVLAGTYVDGTYIYWLSMHGSTTERLFSFACDLSAGVPCLAHKLISQFILLWQFAVGVLLLLGVRSLLFLTIEVGFLLGAGLYADEMNFQVLNIALLCVVFQVGMPKWLLLICLSLLAIDVFEISYLYVEMMQYVS
jgi:hypothetical protein